MKKSLLIFLILLLPSAKAALPSITDYVTYYGSDAISDITQFDLAFLESNNYNSFDINNISNVGTIPICYISIGEDDELHVGDGLGPGGYASWYLDADDNNKPDQNPFWGSYYVDASNPAWQSRILDELSPVIINKGCSGLFLDTIDTIDLYPSTTNGMIELIQKLDAKYPDSYLVANRGFSILQEMAPHVDGIMFESFSSRLVRDNRYEAWTGQDLDWTSSWGLALRDLQQSYPITVFSLDYALPTQQALIDYDYNRALDFGFIPYVSTINLDRIYFHSFTRNPGILPDGYSDSSNDVRRSQIDIIQLKVSSTESSLSLAELLRGTSSSRAYYGVLLDTDFKERTGYKSNAIGADYLMENDILYNYSGDGNSWQWQPIKNVNINLFGPQVTWIVNLSSIDLTAGEKLAFVFYAGQANEQDTTVRGIHTIFQPTTTTSTSTTSSTTTTSSTSIETTTTIFDNTTTTIPTSSTTIEPTSSTTTSTTTSTSSTVLSQTFFFTPLIAFDNYGYDQVSPDDGSLDGTVDLSNNDARWLTNDGDNINVTAWDSILPLGSTITSVIATCEVDFANIGGGYLFFSRNDGFGWNWLCQQVVTSGGNYECNLLSSGVDTVEEVNNLKVGCIMKDMGGPGASGFSIDSIKLQVSTQ